MVNCNVTDARRLLPLAFALFMCVPVWTGAAETITTTADDNAVSGDTLSETLVTGLGFTLTYPSTWSTAPQRYTNMIELVNVPRDRQGQDTPTARIGITDTKLQNESAVLREIQDIQTGLGAPHTAYLSIGGFAAFQYAWIEERDQPDHGPKNADPLVRRVTTAIAAGQQLIRIDAWLPSDASDEVIEAVKKIARSVTFTGGDAPTTSGTDTSLGLAGLSVQDGAAAGESAGSVGSGATETESRVVLRSQVALGAAESFDLGPGFVQQVFPDRNGELEIATSPDGQFIVIGRQSWWSYSQDGGETFTNGGRIPFSNGDPSLAYGVSGNFYYAGIDENDGGGFPNGPGTGSGQCPGPDGTSAFGYSCTNIAVSTDDGQNFPTASIVNAVVCPQADDLDGAGGSAPAAGACFPDQEHIAADRFNPGAGGGDQVYSTWRSFPGGVASLVCSQDSGQTWTAPMVVQADGKFPRITVGQDGFVYVAYYASGNYRLAKYSSCASGLTLQFQRTVHAQNPIVCPFVGHDRCDQNPSSQTVAVDDTNPNHIYYAYAETAGSAGEDRVIVQDSLDGGDTWTRPRVRVNNNIPGKRIMPWMCTTGGEAFVTWYDRRNASVPNDRTDFYGGSAHLDKDGNLIAEADFKINETPDDWCAAGWPCSTRATDSAEQCSVQPQLAGVCRANCAAPASTDSGVACDFSDGCAAAGETCCTGNGCPKYGDYNGSACVAGRLLAGWASTLTQPSSPPIGILFSQVIVGDVPQIQVPNPVTISPICSGEVGRGTLKVCNTGTATLEVRPIASSDPNFTVTTPSAGYPVQISHDFCFEFEVVFAPTTTGPDSATLTITSNDPVNPELDVGVSGNLGQASLSAFIADSGDFGEVCEGSFKDLDLSIQNNGSCPLSVTSIVSSDMEFIVAAGSTPLVIEAGNSVTVPIRYQPDGLGDDTANITVSSNVGNQVVGVTGNAPAPDIQATIANSGEFGDVCKGDNKDLNLELLNQGKCDLTIDSIGILPVGSSFVLPDNLQTPLVLSHDASYSVPIRYQPEECNDDSENATIVIDSDDPDEGQVSLPISGTSPCPNLVIDPNPVTGIHAFPPTVVDSSGTLGCFSERTVTLRNNGGCPLTIESMVANGVSGDSADYAVTAPVTGFPIILPSGEETLGVTLRFTPQADADPLAPSEVTGLLTVSSDDPDGAALADLCGESVAQSGVRILVAEVSSGSPVPVGEVDRIDIDSKGKGQPGPINLTFTDQPLSQATICGNTISYHVDQETLPSVGTAGSNPKSSYQAKAKEGNLQASESFGLGQCEFREFQLQLRDSNSGTCLLLPKGEACTSDGECCSGKCTGPAGGKTCK